MIRSMTGFGRGQDILDGMSISVEIKSVNHRYFDFSCRVPRSYGFLEEKLKTYVQTLVARGKIECYVSICVYRWYAAKGKNSLFSLRFDVYNYKNRRR